RTAVISLEVACFPSTCQGHSDKSAPSGRIDPKRLIRLVKTAGIDPPCALVMRASMPSLVFPVTPLGAVPVPNEPPTSPGRSFNLSAQTQVVRSDASTGSICQI